MLSHVDVKPIGLGARDSLRLEAGLCLYGQDMDEATTPIEAALQFSIGKRRRGEGGFSGADRIQRELGGDLKRVRVGLRLDGRSAARLHMPITTRDGSVVGEVTSGAFTPTAQASIAMGYVPPQFAASGTELAVSIRGATVAAVVVPMPFVPHRYFPEIKSFALWCLGRFPPALLDFNPSQNTDQDMSQTKYTKDHEYVRVEGDVAIIGITHHAQEKLGDVTYVEMPTAGKVLAQKDVAGVVESVKAASDVYAPVSGSVLEANAALADTPELVNSDPEGAAWFFKIALADASELEGVDG